MESTLRRARECLFWPGMTDEIKQVVQNCSACQTYQNRQQKESLLPHETPTRQWEKVGIDLFTWEGKDYQIVVDYVSNFWEVDRMLNTTTTSVIKTLKTHFARYGIPSVVVSDNGPQYTSQEFKDFAQKWDFCHQTSSPGHQRANGKAESAVKAAKLMFTKSRVSKIDPYIALLETRNTPTQHVGTSPAQRFLNRRTRSLLPVTSRLLSPRGEAYLDRDREKLISLQKKQARDHDKNAKDLPTLEEGETVRIQPFKEGKKEWEKAVVRKRLDERSYQVESSRGVFRRNRVHLRRSRESPEPLVSSEPGPGGTTADPDSSPPTTDQPLGREACADSSESAQTIRRSARKARPPIWLGDFVK